MFRALRHADADAAAARHYRFSPLPPSLFFLSMLPPPLERYLRRAIIFTIFDIYASAFFFRHCCRCLRQLSLPPLIDADDFDTPPPPLFTPPASLIMRAMRGSAYVYAYADDDIAQRRAQPRAHVCGRRQEMMFSSRERCAQCVRDDIMRERAARRKRCARAA